jgi:cell wall-associated NlpC family hydrolase
VHRRRIFWVRLLPAALLLALVAPGLAPRADAAPPPTPSTTAGSQPGGGSGDTIGSVTAQLRLLADHNEALTESYNGARIQVAHNQQRLATAMREATTARQQLARSRRALAALLAEQYRQPSFSKVGALLSSNSGSDYLGRMESLSQLTRNRAQVVTEFVTARAAADAATARATRELADANRRRTALAAQQTSLQQRVADYRRRLAALTAAQRAALFTPAPAPSTPPPTVGLSIGGSAAAQTAVKAAMAQLGKPYVYATAGPSTFDCSGLTMYAWAAAGVSIPHQSQVQFGLGTAVPPDKLAPGDLVFFYSDIHHVGLYIGNGMMVHAPTEGDVVKVTAVSVFGSDYMGARRRG